MWRRLLRRLRRVPERVHLTAVALGDQKGVRIMLDITIEQGKQVLITVQPENRLGRPARFDGPVVVEANGTNEFDTDVLEIDETLDPNNLKFIIKGVEPGRAIVTIVGDADLDEGERRELRESIAVTVRQSEAQTIRVTVGPEEDIPVPAAE